MNGHLNVNKYIKVKFKLPKSDWHNHGVENLWAEPTDNKLFFNLRNTPFYAYGYSFLDTVQCKKYKGDMFAEKVFKSSQHSTYRVCFLNEKINKTYHAEVLSQLTKLGCTYEGFGALYAIDVPPETDIEKIFCILTANEEKNIWGFEEANYCHPSKNPRIDH